MSMESLRDFTPTPQQVKGIRTEGSMTEDKPSSEFEKKRDELGLPAQGAHEQLIASRALKTWCKKHNRTHFIPEFLITAWGLGDGSDNI